MAKYEHEGYCPCIWVPKTWNEETDTRLSGLWSLIGDSIVYEDNTANCDEVFGVDRIAYDVLSAIVRKNVNASKIMVRQKRRPVSNTQNIADIMVVLKDAINPEIIAHAGSNFIAILADANYGLDLWVWDLRTAQ